MGLFNSVVKLGLSNGLVTVCLFFLVLFTLALYIHKTYYVRDARFMELASKIPGPTWYPFIGSAYVFGTDAKDILQNVTNCVLKYDTVSKYWIGPSLYICVLDAKDVEVILSNNKLLTKPNAYELMKIAIGDGILVSSGEKWKKRRKALKPTFSFAIYKSYIDVFNAKIKILTDELESQVDKPYINVCPYFHNLIYDILWETIMNTKSNSQIINRGKPDHFSKSVNTAVSETLCRMFQPWLYIDALFNITSTGKAVNAHVKYVHDKINEAISGKRKEGSGNKENGYKDKKSSTTSKIAFLDYTLDHATLNGLTDEDILNETSTIIFAGFDSTSSSLALLCSVLSRRFDLQERIVEEIKSVFGTLEEKPFTYEDLQNMEYLERVVKESLRLYSTIPIAARQLTEEINLPSGYTLPNGSAVVIPFFRLHRDPKLYPNPHVFDPDNFLPERIAARPSYSYCPFSAGVRDCIGKKFAMLQLKAGALCLVRRFWLTPTDFKLELANKMNLNPLNGIDIGFKKRTVDRPVIEGIEKLSKCLNANVDYLNIEFKESYM